MIFKCSRDLLTLSTLRGCCAKFKIQYFSSDNDAACIRIGNLYYLCTCAYYVMT